MAYSHSQWLFYKFIRNFTNKLVKQLLHFYQNLILRKIWMRESFHKFHTVQKRKIEKERKSFLQRKTMPTHLACRSACLRTPNAHSCAMQCALKVNCQKLTSPLSSSMTGLISDDNHDQLILLLLPMLLPWPLNNWKMRGVSGIYFWHTHLRFTAQP